jgi:hypothetical protein
MKCVFYLVMLTACALLFTGQGVAQEWHPSVTEDNKNATWDDTASFLNRWALTTARQGPWSITESSTDTRCKVHLQVKWGSWDFHDVTADLDLAKVDPLTLTVQTKTVPDNPPVPSLTIQGVANEPFFSGREAIWQSKFEDRDFSKVGGMMCPADVKEVKGLHSCAVRPVNAYKFSLFFDSEEDARRYARALLHAVLLCGGTKAVSPF